METVKTNSELKEFLGHRQGTIGFVPTMGALHDGHLSLVRAARNECDTVVVSVFVNPTQFNDPKDLVSYPRTPEQDLKMLAEAGVHLAYMPSVSEIYPEPDFRIFDFGEADKVMEGATRPGHFNGVGQVVSRLFDLVQPHRAYFGEKDFQQVAVIKSLVEQLDYNINIVVCPTIREDDGLAMSSRNTLLTPEHRKAAPKIYMALQEGVELMKKGGVSPREVENYVHERIDSEQLLEVIYFNIVNARTLLLAQSWEETDGVQGCVAVKAGNVRLIDNIRFV